jgi:hypothetical protein
MYVNFILTVLEGIQGFISFVFCMAIIAFLYIIIAKLLKINIVSKSGREIANPKTYDNVKENLLKNSKKIITNIKNVNNSTFKKPNDENSSKFEQIEKIIRLKEQGLINTSEYEVLKKEILNRS